MSSQNKFHHCYLKGITRNTTLLFRSQLSGVRNKNGLLGALAYMPLGLPRP